MDYKNKSTVQEIRERFDKDVERFSNLETGQTATIDATLSLQLVTQAAAACTPNMQRIVDVGCGAGNYTLKILQQNSNLDCLLIDLSLPMLQRAKQRVAAATKGKVEILQGDIRDVPLAQESCDVILAAMVLHHLRGDEEWRDVSAKFFKALRKGGSIWIVDHIEQSIPALQSLMHARWGEYLKGLKGETYRDQVFAYTEKEDTPRPLLFQTDMLRQAGFPVVEVLHKNNLFAAFGAVKQ